jgi:hypothetical protein
MKDRRRAGRPAVEARAGGISWLPRSLGLLQFGLLGSIPFACSSVPSTEQLDGGQACASAQQQGIVSGSSVETYLGLPSSQQRAIVRLVDTTLGASSTAPLCTATVIAPNWAITAAHCLQIQSPGIVIDEGDASPSTLPVQGTFMNSDEDVALLNLALSSDGGTDAGVDANELSDVEPIPVAGSLAPLLSAGDVAEIAGYGLTSVNSAALPNDVQFVVEAVTDINGVTITVNGFGANGACAGDSGGPLLVRQSDGTAAVFAVLSIGSSTCVGEDIYERLDAVSLWIQGIVGPTAQGTLDCGTITAQGRCLYGTSIWCAQDALQAQTCPNGAQCGWSSADSGFRCVSPSSDPCDGVDSVGACRSNKGQWCADGVLQQQTCGPCGVCQIDGQTGGPQCVAGM